MPALHRLDLPGLAWTGQCTDVLPPRLARLRDMLHTLSNRVSIHIVITSDLSTGLGSGLGSGLVEIFFVFGEGTYPKR